MGVPGGWGKRVGDWGVRLKGGAVRVGKEGEREGESEGVAMYLACVGYYRLLILGQSDMADAPD